MHNIKVPHTVDTLVFAVVVDILKIAQDLDGRDVASSFIDNALRTMRHQVLQKNQGLHFFYVSWEPKTS